MDEPKKSVSLQVHIPDHLRAAISTNVVRVTTTTEGDVLIDFVFSHPQDMDEKGNRLGTLVSRIEMPVQVAKELEAILASHMEKLRRNNMQIQEYKTKKISKVKSSKVIPSGYTVQFVISPKINISKNYGAAKVLAEHIDIVAESRELIKKGASMTWEELLSSNGQTTE